MTYIPQKQIDSLARLLIPGKVIVLYGARRVGKTTLLKQFLKTVQEKYLFVTGDDIFTRQYLESQSIEKLRAFVGDHKLLVVDEAQYIKQVGLNLKIIIDSIPEMKIIASGSSSFELAKDIGEPLTGRKYTLNLFPLAQMEISQIETRPETDAHLETRLLYGSYPEVVTTSDYRRNQDYLKELVNAYLFKDILELEGVRHADKLFRLLQLIAFQIGKEMSLNELGRQIGMSKNSVDRYLDLLAKTFVVFRRNGYNRNLRKEISKNPRYYFYDCGIRNAVIGNFNPIANRFDIGELWENYFVSEMLKKHEYSHESTNSYFWRTYDKKEIDLIEERQGKLYAYEIKWSPGKGKISSEWKKSYPDSKFDIIHRENYLSYLMNGSQI